jgi:hypothetical protein
MCVLQFFIWNISKKRGRRFTSISFFLQHLANWRILARKRQLKRFVIAPSFPDISSTLGPPCIVNKLYVLRLLSPLLDRWWTLVGDGTGVFEGENWLSQKTISSLIQWHFWKWVNKWGQVGAGTKSKSWLVQFGGTKLTFLTQFTVPDF